MTIGEVLGVLRTDFPDVTISKIRFLESEGLVEPDRTAAGYRKFSAADLARLRYVLTAQRDHYLPLRVIREHLDAIDRGLHPEPPRPEPPSVPVPGAPHGLATPDRPQAAEFGPEHGRVRLSRAELLREAGLDEQQLRAAEQYGLIPRPDGGYYDEDALAVASVLADLARFGVESRHLRAFRTAADREVGLVEQVVAPLLRHRGPDAQARADETVRELAALCVRLHTALVRAGLRADLGHHLGR